jgi:hypothetical protein
VAAAAANQAFKRGAHLFVGGMGIFVEQGFGREHPSIQAVTALEGLFGDEGFLYGVGIAFGGEPFEGDDLFSGYGGNGQHARAHRAVIDEDGAGAALAEAASEAGIIQGQIVAQDVQQRAIGFDVDGVRLTIYFQRYVVHENLEAQMWEIDSSVFYSRSKPRKKWRRGWRPPRGGIESMHKVGKKAKAAA